MSCREGPTTAPPTPPHTHTHQGGERERGVAVKGELAGLRIHRGGVTGKLETHDRMKGKGEGTKEGVRCKPAY